MDKRTFKDAIYTSISALTKAFGHANRLEILDLLANGEKTVEQIATQTAITIANASQHLQVLKSARLVKPRREGNFIYYALHGKKVYAAWKALRDLALETEPGLQHTLRQFRQAAGSPDSLTIDVLPSANNPLLLDVRPKSEFEVGHLPDAISIPIQDLPLRLHELPHNRTIVAYCRGPFCTFADEAVCLLLAHGFDAIRLEESVLDFEH